MAAQVDSDTATLPDKINVYYSAENVVDSVDDAVAKALSKLGYTRYGSGYDLVKNVRDIAFELNE